MTFAHQALSDISGDVCFGTANQSTAGDVGHSAIRGMGGAAQQLDLLGIFDRTQIG